MSQPHPLQLFETARAILGHAALAHRPLQRGEMVDPDAVRREALL